MKRINLIRGFTFAIVILALFFSSCEGDKKALKTDSKTTQTYTCPMHPQIVQEGTGSCPICGMDLVAFNKDSESTSVTLNDNQRALANVSTTTIGIKGFSSYRRLNGRLTVNPEKTEYISSRVPGRVEELYVRQTGEKVNKGQALYRIYSEQLATLQKEYLLAVEQANGFPGDATFRRLLESSRQKLELYGQSAGQIKQLMKSRKTDPFITFSAFENGIVAELSITEGQYVSEGSPILKLEGYSRLWVEADIYATELEGVKEGQKVKVIIPGWEDRPQFMTISFITPSLQAGSQVYQIRGEIPNLDDQWKPGLQANIFLPKTTSTGSISLPVDAVIREGKGAHVWVEKTKGEFEPRMVRLGLENFDQVEIEEGLDEGDTVVTSGAYLLYSEYILKKGKNPMDGHNHQ